MAAILWGSWGLDPHFLAVGGPNVRGPLTFYCRAAIRTLAVIHRSVVLAAAAHARLWACSMDLLNAFGMPAF